MKKNQIRKKHKSNKSGGYLVSFLLIAAGTLLLTKNLGLLDLTYYKIFMSWQMLVMVIGLYTLFHRKYLTGLIIAGTGFYFLLPKIGFIDASFSEIFLPAALIFLGIYFIIHISRAKVWAHSNRNSFQQYSTSTDGYIHSENIFSSVKHIIAEEVFKGANIRNKFGGVILDLRRSVLTEEFTYIDVDSKFGGIELYIPAHWNVKMELDSFVGGCEDSRLPVANIDTQHILVLRGNLSFSGIEIKS